MSRSTRRLIVKFNPSEIGASQTLQDLCDQVAEMTHGSLVRPPSGTGRAVFEVDPELDMDQLVRQVSALPAVEYAEPDAVDRI